MLGGGVPLGARTGSSPEPARWFSGPGRSLGGTDTRPGTASPKWLAVAGGPGREGTGPVDGTEPAEAIEPTVGMGPAEGTGPGDGRAPIEGMGPGVWKAGALNEDGASGGGTGAGVGQAGPELCRGGTRGCVRAEQVTRASEQKEETSRLSSHWPREKAFRAQERGGGQRGEGASSKASSRR